MQKREASHRIVNSHVRVDSSLDSRGAVLFSLPEQADNSVHLECPVYAPDGGTDSIGIQNLCRQRQRTFCLHARLLAVYGRFRVYLRNSRTGDHVPSQNGNFLAQVFPPDNQIAIAWYAFLPQMPYPPHPVRRTRSPSGFVRPVLTTANVLTSTAAMSNATAIGGL